MPQSKGRLRAVTLTIVCLPVCASVTGATATGDIFVLLNQKDVVQLCGPVKRAFKMRVKQGDKIGR